MDITQRRADLLDPAMLAALGRIELVARWVVDGFIAGLHRSPRKGFSVEFAEHRPYQPGDDLRYVDWRIAARIDRWVVKHYEEETNLRATLVLDVSASMAWTGDPARLTKLAYAERLVAAVARPEVIREYEGLFARSGLTPGNITLPSLSLLGLLPAESEDSLVVNLEDDSLSITAVVGAEPAFFRQKPFVLDREPGTPLGRRVGPLVKEIENTALFLEDKEGKKVRAVWLRAPSDNGEDLAAELGRQLALPVQETGSLVPGDATGREKALLSALYGQLS